MNTSEKLFSLDDLKRRSENYTPCIEAFVHTLLQSSRVQSPTSNNNTNGPLPRERLADALQDILYFYEAHAEDLFDAFSPPLSFELGNISLSVLALDSACLAFTIPAIASPQTRRELTFREYIDDSNHAYFPPPEVEIMQPLARLKLADVFAVPLCTVAEAFDAEHQTSSPNHARSTSTKARISPNKDLRTLFQHPHLQPPLAVLETSSFCAMAYPTLPSLQSTLSFNSHSLSEFQLQFISFQIQGLQRYFDHFGIKCNCSDFRQVFLDDGFWVYFRLPMLAHVQTTARVMADEFTPPHQQNCEKNRNAENDAIASVHVDEALKDDPFMAWVTGRLSNLDYLLYLNALQGRDWNICFSHPIVPWCTDFVSPSFSDHLKDFSKTQYRRKKGDEQLDMTFQSEPSHHLTTFLTDLSYYTYKARISPKSCLLKHVRDTFVPLEFAASMALLYAWTADECIPEFYTSPSIFISRHPDMPDLKLPSWAATPAEFIVKHRHILESASVSAILHEWIDLVFGYKLAGAAAEESKNVVLALAHPEHASMTPHHTVQQLFHRPHPPRFSVTSLEAIQTVAEFRHEFPHPRTLPNPVHPALAQLYHALAAQRWPSTPLCSDAYVIFLNRTLANPHLSLYHWIDQAFLKMNQADFQTVFGTRVLQQPLRPMALLKYFGISFLSNQGWAHLSRTLLNELQPKQFKDLFQLCIALGPFLMIQKVIPFLSLVLKKAHTLDHDALSHCFVQLATTFGIGFTHSILIPMLLSECKLHLSETLYLHLQHLLRSVCTAMANELSTIQQILESIFAWSMQQSHPKPVMLWLNIVQAMQLRPPGHIKSQEISEILEKCLVDYLSLASKNDFQACFERDPVLLAYTMLCNWLGRDYVQTSMPWILEIEQKLQSASGTLPTLQLSPTVLHIPMTFAFEDIASGEIFSLPQKRDAPKPDERQSWHDLLSASWPSVANTFKNQALMAFAGHPGLKTIMPSPRLRVMLSGGRDRAIKIWSLNFYKHLEASTLNPLLGSYTRHSDIVREICFLGPLAASNDGTVRVWDVETTETLRHVHTKGPLKLVQSWTDARLLVGVARNNLILMDDIRSRVHPFFFSTGLSTASPLRSMAIDPQHGILAVGSASGMISVLDLRVGALLSTWKAHESEIRQLRFVNDGLFSVAQGNSSTLILWNKFNFSAIKSIKVNKLNDVHFLEHDCEDGLLAMDHSGHLAFISSNVSSIYASVKLRPRTPKTGPWLSFRSYFDGPQRFLFSAAQDGLIHCFY